MVVFILVKSEKSKKVVKKKPKFDARRNFKILCGFKKAGKKNLVSEAFSIL